MNEFQEAAEQAAEEMVARQQDDAESAHNSKVGTMAGRIAEALLTLAALQVKLEDLRKDPEASAEKVMQAAQSFRGQEAEVTKLMTKMVTDEIRHIRDAQ